MSTEEVHDSSHLADEEEELNDYSCFRFLPKKLCHPSYALHRYFVLIFMCFLGFGSNYCYDNPGSLQNQIVSDMGITVGSFSQLYAWYSWPNTVLCFFGGFMIDRVLGIRLGAIVFAGFILLGQLVFAGGALFDMYWLMIVGRFIFGIGSESLAVVQNNYAVSWFKEKELNMVFGLQLSVARVGSTVSFVTMVKVYDTFSSFSKGNVCLGFALLFASITCVFSLICAIILAFFDKRAVRILKKQNANTGEVVNITDAKNFSFSFWLICMICVAYYVTIFPFTSLGSMFFQRKYNMSQETANFVDSIIYVISAILSPILGILIDYTGRNLMWVFAASVITLVSHAMLAFTFVHPLFAMIVMGVGYSILACALWPMVSLVIPEHQLGTAYGIMQSIQNLGLGTVVLAAGYIVDLKGYIVLEVFFLAWISLCLIILTVLYITDQRAGGMLNMSVQQRKDRKCQENSIQVDYKHESSGPSSTVFDKKDI